MVARGTCCIRQLGDGDGGETKSFRRLLANEKVTSERLVEGWADQTAGAAAGRHVLALQDSSNIKFNTSGERTRGLGKVGKGRSRGVMLHAMLAIDAQDGSCLGLVGGAIWTRPGRVEVPHSRRELADKESKRWLDTAHSARTVLEQATCITVIADRESDIYAEWATLPDPKLHLLTRVMHDRALADDSTLYQAGEKLDVVDTRTIELRTAHKRQPRTARLCLRFGSVPIKRPRRPGLKGLPAAVQLTLVEVVELDPPDGVEPIHWRLLTTHPVADAAAAWQIIDWYKMRWVIEQLFRVLKSHGLRIEDSQLDSAELLIKLIAFATKAATITIQLLQARDGADLPAAAAFNQSQIEALAAINARYQQRSPRQKNPHPQASMPWASWIIGRLGGWDGYRSSRPPGPITLKHGLDRFFDIAQGWTLRNVSTP